jgi:hypothetical protein
MNDHAIMQPCDGLAARADEKPRDDGMYETGQCGAEQRNPEAEGAALMLEVRLTDRSRVVEK